MLVWFLHFGAGRNKAHAKTETRFKEVLQRSLGNLFNHCLEFYLDIRGFFPKNSFKHSVRELRSLPKNGFVRSSIFQSRTNYLGPPKDFLRATRDIFAWQYTTCLGLPKELIKIKCRTSSSPPLGQPRHLCMAPCNLS
jgi:hypothetical protein